MVPIRINFTSKNIWIGTENLFFTDNWFAKDQHLSETINMSLQIHHPRQSLHGVISHQTHVNAEMLSKGNARTWTSHNSPNKADQDDWNEGVYDQEEYTFADEINMPCACISMNGTIVDVNETFCNLVGENDLHNIVNRKTILDYCYADDLNHNLSVLQTLVYGESDLDNSPRQALLRAVVPGIENGMYMVSINAMLSVYATSASLPLTNMLLFTGSDFAVMRYKFHSLSTVV